MAPASLSPLFADTVWFAPYKAAVDEAYASMDAAYDDVARHYGFRCSGCEDNCCRTRFYHHTLSEMCTLFDGYSLLDSDVAAEVALRARSVVEAMARADDGGAVFDTVCPVNDAGLCLLYAHRPMICRLHGLPSAMTRPDGASMPGTGCDAFHQRHGTGDAPRLDRTPHYTRMAQLEQRLRRVVGWEGRLKLTVADMICLFDDVFSAEKGRAGA
ncbi:MAG: hypothetical protein ABIL58_05350 [Pseudomonadota bacterium]